MLKICKILEIKDDLIKIFDLKKNDEFFSCNLDDKIIGYAVIRQDETDRIYITILNDYQNQGYGSFLFKEIINLMQEKILLKVDLDNTKMQRIVEKNSAIEIGRDGKFIHYIINLNPDKI